MHAPLTIAYGYAPQSHAYSGEVNAFLDPRASSEDTPVYILPANATWSKPPADALPEFCRQEYHGDVWQVSPDRETLDKEIERRIAEAGAQVNVLEDLVSVLNDDAQTDPDDTSLQAELKETKTAASAWKRYRLELTRMSARINDLDVLALEWPVRPAV